MKNNTRWIILTFVKCLKIIVPNPFRFSKRFFNGFWHRSISLLFQVSLLRQWKVTFSQVLFPFLPNHRNILRITAHGKAFDFSDVRSAKFSRVKFSAIQQRIGRLIQPLSIRAFFFHEYAQWHLSKYSHPRMLRLSNFQSKRVIIAPGNCNTSAFTPLSV